MGKAGLYIHIPFCAAKCKYCAFVSQRSDESTQKRYVERLVSEIEAMSPKLTTEVDTIFFGGGTPSILYKGGVAKILESVRKNITLSKELSITAEANPDSLTADKAAELADAGINRLSIGLQSADDKITAHAGRIHTFADFERALNNAVKMGFGDISCDIMLGLPMDTVEGVRRTIRTLGAMNEITHISAYGLKTEEGTPWAGLEVDDDLTADMYDCAVEELASYQYFRYEVSNFARSGYESKHNLKYWLGLDYLGVGVAAHSFVDGVRLANANSFSQYMQGVGQTSTVLTDEDKEHEFVMLRLRLVDGFCKEDYRREFGVEFQDRYSQPLNWLTKNGFVIDANGRIKVAPDKFGVLNQIILKFF